MKIISFEGSIGAGKTSLTNYFSYELKCGRLCEDFQANPFLKKFYENQDVNFETEITFLLIHYSQIRQALSTSNSELMLIDFSIEKDLAYARMNLQEEQLEIFENIFNYLTSKIQLPDLVIYVELSPKILRRRIFQRGREYELNADLEYFDKYHKTSRNFFLHHANSEVILLNVDDLVLDPDDPKIIQIREAILSVSGRGEKPRHTTF